LAAATYAWDLSGDLGYYNALTNSIQAARPVDNEAGGTIWTTLLQKLALNYTGTPKLNIPICLLLPTSGGLAALGFDEIRAIDVAVAQANMILKSGSSGVNFSDTFRYDSASLNTIAKTGFDFLTGAPDNCQVVIGATGSDETSGFLSDANSRHVPAISPSSTAASLAIAGDYLFRTSANDLAQAPATATWIYHQGIRYLSIIAINSTYGQGLADGIDASFTSLGGHVANYSTLFYAPYGLDSPRLATDTLNIQIGMILSSHLASQVGVLIVDPGGGDQTILSEAASQTNLRKVVWFGTDGVAGDPALLPPIDGGTGSPSIAQFVASINLTGSIPTVSSLGLGGATMSDLAYSGTTILKVGGGTINLRGTGYLPTYSITPQYFWNNAYDAATLAMLAILKGNSYNGTCISTWLGRTGTRSIANITIGATGLDALTPTGDRAVQHFSFYGYYTETIRSISILSNAIVSFVVLAVILSPAIAAIGLKRKRRLRTNFRLASSAARLSRD
jgi:ABC-type branched-subunit amino acid transport system substrate-binding protein